jgi:hypothetical protein
VGLAMMLFGSFVLAAVDIKNFRFTSAVWFALYGAIVYAVVSIFAKYAYNGASFSGVFLWVSIGFGVGGLIAFVLHKDKKQFRILFTQRDKKIPLILLGDELLEISGELVQGAAIHGGPVTVVRGLEGIQPLYVLAIGIILSQFFPRYFREHRDERFRKKVLCMIFMIVGLFMI